MTRGGAMSTDTRSRDEEVIGVLPPHSIPSEQSVLNVLLAWPDCCFRPETVTHPRTRELIHFTKSIFDDATTMPKEDELVAICREAQAQGRKVQAYTTYTGKRDTTSRLKRELEQAGLKVAVLRSTVDTGRREDWIADRVLPHRQLRKSGPNDLACPPGVLPHRQLRKTRRTKMRRPSCVLPHRQLRNAGYWARKE